MYLSALWTPVRNSLHLSMLQLLKWGVLLVICITTQPYIHFPFTLEILPSSKYLFLEALRTDRWSTIRRKEMEGRILRHSSNSAHLAALWIGSLLVKEAGAYRAFPDISSSLHHYNEDRTYRFVEEQKTAWHTHIESWLLHRTGIKTCQHSRFNFKLSISNSKQLTDLTPFPHVFSPPLPYSRAPTRGLVPPLIPLHAVL